MQYKNSNNFCLIFLIQIWYDLHFENFKILTNLPKITNLALLWRYAISNGNRSSPNSLGNELFRSSTLSPLEKTKLGNKNYLLSVINKSYGNFIQYRKVDMLLWKNENVMENYYLEKLLKIRGILNLNDVLWTYRLIRYYNVIEFFGPNKNLIRCRIGIMKIQFLIEKIVKQFWLSWDFFLNLSYFVQWQVNYRRCIDELCPIATGNNGGYNSRNKRRKPAHRLWRKLREW